MSERSEGGKPRLDAQQILARVRAVVRQTAPVPRERAPVPQVGSVSSQVLGRTDEALSRAERYWQVGAEVPPMTRVRGVLRKVAVPVAKAILRAAELVARDQRSYNRAALDAMRLMRTVLEEVPRLRKEVWGLREEVAALRAELEAEKSRK